MRSIFTKSLLILPALFTACICNCDDIPPFSDYHSINTTVNKTEISDGDTLVINLSPESLFYLTRQRIKGLDLVGSAYACSCADDGYYGNKYGITDLKIYANKDFNDSLKAGVNLNGLFNITAEELEDITDIDRYNTHTIDTMLKQLDPPLALVFLTEYHPDNYGNISLRLGEKPTKRNEPYSFTIEVLKSNGARIITHTAEVSWK